MAKKILKTKNGEDTKKKDLYYNKNKTETAPDPIMEMMKKHWQDRKRKWRSKL